MSCLHLNPCHSLWGTEGVGGFRRLEEGDALVSILDMKSYLAGHPKFSNSVKGAAWGLGIRRAMGVPGVSLRPGLSDLRATWYLGASIKRIEEALGQRAWRRNGRDLTDHQL